MLPCWVDGLLCWKRGQRRKQQYQLIFWFEIIFIVSELFCLSFNVKPQYMDRYSFFFVPYSWCCTLYTILTIYVFITLQLLALVRTLSVSISLYFIFFFGAVNRSVSFHYGFIIYRNIFTIKLELFSHMLIH